MDPSRALALLVVGLIGCVAVFFLVRRIESDPVLDSVIAWAKRTGKTTRGDGFGQPFEVVGLAADRWFTVSYDANTRVLLIGLDCDAEDRQAGGDNRVGHPAGGPPRVQDEALVTRWTKPTVEQVNQLDEVIAAMVGVAQPFENAPPLSNA